MVYLTIIICVVVMAAVVMYIANNILAMVVAISDTIHDMADRQREVKVEEYEQIGKMFTQMVYGPGNVPTKTAEDILRELGIDGEDDELAFPPHESQDEFLRWVPNQETELALLDLPEHEEDDEFMNGVINADY